MNQEYRVNQQYDFVHFQSSADCELNLINNKHINVSHKCCGGKGYAILRKNIIHQTIPVCTRPQFIPIQGTCDICFAEDVSLYNTCKTCNQPFCKPCLDKITSKVCPYCRGQLKNNF